MQDYTMKNVIAMQGLCLKNRRVYINMLFDSMRYDNGII